MSLNLDQSVQQIPGVGAVLASKLKKIGIVTINDLLMHFPRRYDDFSTITPINEMKPGLVTFQGKIIKTSVRRAKTRRLTITEAIITDGTGTIKAVWFNQPYMASSLPKDQELVISGKLEFRNNDLALQTPNIEIASQAGRDTGIIVPVYPETAGISSKALRRLIQPIVQSLGDIPESLPEIVINKWGLMRLTEALGQIHFPNSPAKLSRARYRLSFEELFVLMLTGQVIKREIKTESAPKLEFRPDVAKDFVARLSYKLTDAQRSAAWQILKDLEGEFPMNRLLEGDVGSGKTAVAALAMVMTSANGYQAALMSPTEILARQHFHTLSPLLTEMGYRVRLLAASLPTPEKALIQEQLARGEVDIVIGTQALLSEKINFWALGLTVIDEQHRFGVEQRKLLKQKAGRLPHLLSMTATPIPRSLALTVYGDLDISIIDKMPPGRIPPTTIVYQAKARDRAYRIVEEQIEAGRQAFIVYPQINQSDQSHQLSAVAEAESLQKGIFKHRRIGLVHGKLNGAQKAEVMAAFVAGDLDILVATTVIEVGIDVPNATAMVVWGAERFGLATLHQLRGRIGRAGHSSWCLLISTAEDNDEGSRLSAMVKTTDGFRLAQIDLEIRGPGQIYGQKQHGRLDLKLADLADAKLLSAARQAAIEIVNNPSVMIKYPQLVERVNQLKAVTTLD